MKKLTFLFLLFVSAHAYSQDTILSEEDGITLSYKLSKLQDGDKKDSYLITVKATNKNTFDVFYNGPKNGVNPFFAEVTVRNIDQNVYLTATESKLMTSEGRLYYLRASGSVSGEKEFKIGKGITPVITSKFFNDLKQISEFR